MRVPNDLRLLESDVGIDLILGGHDHHYETQEVSIVTMEMKHFVVCE